MNRQLYGVGSLVGREKFGIGSKLKRFVRKIIPNEVADVAVKAAPFVAPFNPALGGAMAGLGSFDQSGSISKGVKSGLLNYGLGQGARYLGGAGVQGNPFEGKLFSSPLGTETGIGKFLDQRKAAQIGQAQKIEEIKVPQYEELFAPKTADVSGVVSKVDPSLLKTSTEATTSSAFKESLGKITSGDFNEMGQGLKELGGQGLKAVFTKPVPGSPGETQIDKLAIGATIAGGVSYLDAKRLAEEAELVGDADEYTEEMYEADKARYSNYYADIITPAAFGLKEGGRVKYSSGSTPFGVPSITLDEKEEAKTLKEILREMDEEKISILNPIKAFIKKAGEGDGIDLEALKKEVEENPTMVNEITDIEFGVGKSGPYTDQGPYIKVDEEKEIEDMLNELDRELNKKADGGRIGFFEGSDDPSDPKFSPQRRSGIISINPMQDDTDELLTGGGGIGGILSPFTRAEKSFLFKTLAKQGGSDRTFTMPQLYKIFKNPGKFKKDESALKAFLKIKMGKKEGGRIGFDMGSPREGISSLASPEDLDLMTIKATLNQVHTNNDDGEGGGINAVMKFMEKNPEYKVQVRENIIGDQGDKIMVAPIEEIQAVNILDQLKGDILKMPENKAQGGRIGYMMGSEVPVRNNQGGITELDYRNTGGFVPVGIKEKADDVPAMLSKNEFVMTADAVRGIGNGDVETGAQKLYNIMKQAEKQGIA